jgi:hypothetical protein
MPPVNAETLHNLLTAMQTDIESRVANDSGLPSDQRKSNEDEPRNQMGKAFAERVDSRIEGRLTDEFCKSWDEMQREQLEDNRQNLSFMNSLIKLIDKLKQPGVSTPSSAP